MTNVLIITLACVYLAVAGAVGQWLRPTTDPENPEIMWVMAALWPITVLVIAGASVYRKLSDRAPAQRGGPYREKPK